MTISTRAARDVMPLLGAIWLSEKRDVFIQNALACSLRKTPLLITAVYRGDYHARGIEGNIMTKRKRYSLSELVAQCDPNAPTFEAFREWEQAPMAGIEQAITQHAIDVITQAIGAWESREQALEWLQRPVPALEHKRPCDLLGTQEGCRRIASVLRKIEQGDFS